LAGRTEMLLCRDRKALQRGDVIVPVEIALVAIRVGQRRTEDGREGKLRYAVMRPYGEILLRECQSLRVCPGRQTPWRFSLKTRSVAYHLSLSPCEPPRLVPRALVILEEGQIAKCRDMELRQIAGHFLCTTPITFSFSF